VTSAFIIQVHPQLQPDPNEETAALLRVLIHKIDNTTFGGDVPALPQWTGPPRTTVQVQCILYASLTASLLSAFLAMLGKQWLNRYSSVDMRGSAIERSQNRQRKLDGIIAWYFNYVLESLPLMLQGALLLLGCALSQYLWEIDTTIASVVLGVTSFGALFYLFIVVAGAASDSCPYQTPGANVIRRFSGLVRSAYALFVERSGIYSISGEYWDDVAGNTMGEIIFMTLLYPFVLPVVLVIDIFRLGRAAFRSLVAFARRAISWLFSTSPIPNQAFDDQATKLDLHCILWMLQTSLDKTINLSTLDFLREILPLSGLDSSTTSAVVVNCFNSFTSCFVISDGFTTMVTRGSEQLAGISAMCFLRAFSYLSSIESGSTIIKDVRQRYRRGFPSLIDPQDLPCPIVMGAIHSLLARPWERPHIDWRHYNPSTDELVPLSCALVQAAQFEYLRGGDDPWVPNWLVGFALRFLSQDQLPPTSVVIDCLTMIATALGCNVSDIGVVPDERRVCTSITTVSWLIPHQCAG